ncbi:hypothetical protein P3X46_003716 [Hevea brasiliensis]|uniref:Glycosyl transferase CAP10 domain-containing protein n=1 Tax=Hevea brasiliensis TaxID=3981 RepID=A0ABQ9N9J7_HEVBR|nr:uncharacterized protein LOC110669489 [Hevea brasiliensis]KAJ9188352.1 hypothetical protein P3X46_003716 [Hevea brasiliensis]
MADKLKSLHGQLRTHFSTAHGVVKRWASATIFLFFIVLLVVAFIFRINDYLFVNFLATKHPKMLTGFPLICSDESLAKTCKANYYPLSFEARESSDFACPDYFRWIHEDLRPWKSAGISKDMVERAKDIADFRLVIIEGKVYVEIYHKSYQTRDFFTIWGILQLLRLYPGRVPDLELVFSCGDRPRILKQDYQGPNATLPLAMFQYSGHEDALGITFPDWSFWGWPEVNIRPWESMLARLIEGSKKRKWKGRVPYAYWKGNPAVSRNRVDLMKCNLSDKHEWNARLYAQNWLKETEQGFKHSNLEDQCTHRYKILIEGFAWSVSDKYILSCDSMTLLIKPDYYDFFLRSLVPMQHYWPINSRNKCRDIKFAVEWGNSHPHKAQTIGKAGSRFIQENLKMEYVYAYMFHLFREYAKLLKFKPEIPAGGVEICSESMACPEDGERRKFMLESMVKSPSDTLPCTMPSPFDPSALNALFEKSENIKRQVMMWEKEHWENLRKTQSRPRHH